MADLQLLPYRSFFDSQGNAWTLAQDQTSENLVAVQSIGHTGRWMPPEILVHDRVFDGEGAINAFDEVLALGRIRIRGSFHLTESHYLPGVGWSPPASLFSGSFFKTIAVAADENSNFVVVINRYNGPPHRLFGTYFDRTTQQWSALMPIGAADADAVQPSLVRNRDGSTLALIFGVPGLPWWHGGGQRAGIFAQLWNSSLKTWGPAVLLPGTDSYIESTNLAPLATVGNDGEMTVVWHALEGEKFVLRGSRTRGGIWQEPTVLLPPPSRAVVSYNGNADIASNSSGDVLFVLSRLEPGESLEFVHHTYAIRYTDGDWSVDNLLTYTWGHGGSFDGKVRAAFLDGRQAVATAASRESGEYELVSFLFDGEQWSNVVEIPHAGIWTWPERPLCTDRGEALQIYPTLEGTRSTWFRTSQSKRR